MMQNFKKIVTFLIAPFLLSSCDLFGDQKTDEYLKVVSFSLIHEKSNYFVGDKFEDYIANNSDLGLNVLITYSDGSNYYGLRDNYTVEIKNTSTLEKVNSNSAFTKSGEYNVSVKYEELDPQSFTINVLDNPIEKIEFSEESFSLEVNGTKQLSYTITPSNASNQNVVFTSSKESVATVSNSGLVKGIAAGEATITVKTYDNKVDTVTVNVYVPKVYYSVKIKEGNSESSQTIEEGSFFILPSPTNSKLFLGWECGTSLYSTSQSVTVNSDMTFIAKYKQYNIDLKNDEFDIVYSDNDFCGYSVATELKNYIYKRTNKNHNVVKDNSYISGHDFISVGETSLLANRSSDFVADGISVTKQQIYSSFTKKDSYAICVKDNGMFLFGNSSDSLRYASAKFIEQYLGITFLTNNDEYIEQEFSLDQLTECGQIFNPYFDTRMYLNSGSWACSANTNNEKYIDHMGFNSAIVNEFNPSHNHNNLWITGTYKDVNNNDINLSTSHNVFDPITDKGIVKVSNHPKGSEIWFENNGEIIDICYSNGIDSTNNEPKLTSSTSSAAYCVYQNVRKILETYYSNHDHSQVAHLAVGQRDTNLYCNCSQCRTAASTLGRSGITIKFWNAIIGKILDESTILKDCNFKLMCFAYQYNLVAPKVKNTCTIPNSDHLIVQVAPLVQDQYLGIGEKAINEIQIDNGRIYDVSISSENYIKGKDIYPGWKEFGSNLISWNYDSMFGYGYPLYIGGVARIEDTINVLKKNGFNDSMIQGSYTDGSSLDQWINAYVYSKLCWDDSENINLGSLPSKAIYYRNDFIKKFFGKSSQMVIDSFDSLDSMYDNALKNSADGLRTWVGSRGESTTKACGFFSTEAFKTETVTNIYLAIESEIVSIDDDVLFKRLKRFELTPLMHLTIKNNLFREPFISLCKYLNITWLGEGLSLTQVENDPNFFANF